MTVELFPPAGMTGAVTLLSPVSAGATVAWTYEPSAWSVRCHSFVPEVASLATLPTMTLVMDSEPVAVISRIKDLTKEKEVPVAVGVGMGVTPTASSILDHLTAETAAIEGPDPVA